MKVRFHEVGRGKQDWCAECDELSYDWLEKQVRKHGHVMSRDLDFDFDEGTRQGSVWVGGMRKVGTFDVVAEKELVRMGE